MPFSFIILLKSSAVPRPQSLLMTRKSTFFSSSLSTIPLNAAASIADGGEMRKMKGLPVVVILPDEEVSTTIGTSYSISFGITASVRLEPHAPIITGTLSLVISFSATAAASVGLLLLSSMTSSIFLPRMPPLALISSAAILAPLTT